MINMKLTIVGSLAYDTIFTGSGEANGIIGGSAIYAGISAVNHLRRSGVEYENQIGLVGIIGSDFQSNDLSKLRQQGLDLSGVTTSSGNTFRWIGRYSGDMSEAETIETHLNVFANFTPTIPDHFTAPEIVFCANMHPNLQLSVLDQIRPESFSALDSMNLWIQTERDSLSNVLSRVDMAILNENEVKLISGRTDLFESALLIQNGEALSENNSDKPGPKFIVIKRAANGAIALTPDGFIESPSCDNVTLIDPTGCGDSFAGALLSHLAISHKNGDSFDKNSIKNALSHANVTASFTLSSFGVDSLINIDDTSYSSRFQQYESNL